jgi:macrolide-specific efflux system membrane fusion protein
MAKRIIGLLKKFWMWLGADKKRMIGAVIILLILIIGFWRISAAKNSKVQYQTSAVAPGTIVSSVSASGQISTSNLINVGSQATGVVKAVFVKDGDTVFAGQKIAEITLDSDGALANAKAWQNLSSAQNAYRATQASLANVYDQIQGHATDETFAMKETRTKAEVANDNAWVALAAAGLSYSQTSPVITAPMTGMVDNITITPGMILAANSSSTSGPSSARVAVITTQGNPLATFNVSEVDVSRVKQGQKATITLDSISGKTFTGKVLTVDKIGTVVSGVTNYAVTIAFDTTDPQILPNMAATANIIITAKSDVLLIPSDAIQVQTDGTSTVDVLKNGQPQTVTVETGLTSDTQTEITSGLNAGDEVITGTTTGNSTQAGSNSPFSTFRVGGGTTGGAVRVGGGGR